jgi:ribosomal protein L16/L10AE
MIALNQAKPMLLTRCNKENRDLWRQAFPFFLLRKEENSDRLLKGKWR